MKRRWLESLTLALLALPVNATLSRAADPEPTPNPTPAKYWVEHFDGKSLKALGWEGGNLSDGKIDHFLVQENGGTFLRSQYQVGTEAKFLRKEVEWDAEKFPILRWRWRVNVFPKNAKVMDSDRSDAGAQVYLLWRRFPIYYVIKYFWSNGDTAGEVLRQNGVLAGELWGLILRAGGKTGEWQTETRNIYEDYVKGFGHKPPGNVRGLAVLSDGDETKSPSEADYDDFEIMTSTDVPMPLVPQPLPKPQRR